MKVVFHVNELEKWSTVVGNINNLLKADAKMKAIEIVANGEAVKGYLQADLGIALHELAEKRVILNSCQNAMNHFEMTKETLPPFVGVVPAGILRLVECQTEGYAYIKS